MICNTRHAQHLVHIYLCLIERLVILHPSSIDACEVLQRQLLEASVLCIAPTHRNHELQHCLARVCAQIACLDSSSHRTSFLIVSCLQFLHRCISSGIAVCIQSLCLSDGLLDNL